MNLQNSKIKFKDQHNLKSSTFPNGCVCGHLHEIRGINFTAICDIHSSPDIIKNNVPFVNIKLRTH